MMNRKMLKQAQQLQKRMEQMQEEMETLTVEGSAGGGAVTAIVTGKMQVLSITIDPDVVDPDDVDLLQDMVLAAVNDGLHKGRGDSEQTDGLPHRRIEDTGVDVGDAFAHSHLASHSVQLDEQHRIILLRRPGWEARRRASQAAGDRPQDGPATGVPPYTNGG